MAKTWFITGTTTGFGAATMAGLHRGDKVTGARHRPRPHYLTTSSATACASSHSTSPTPRRPRRSRLGCQGIRPPRRRRQQRRLRRARPTGRNDETRTSAPSSTPTSSAPSTSREPSLPALRAQRSGYIVQLSSVGGRRRPSADPYETTKFAVEGHSDGLADEVAHLGINVPIVEPGRFRTKWAAGAATATTKISEDYQHSVGTWITRFADYSGNEPGDPARAAHAILQLVDTDNPPLRLLLGSDAYQLAAEDSDARTAEAEQWEKTHPFHRLPRLNTGPSAAPRPGSPSPRAVAGTITLSADIGRLNLPITGDCAPVCLNRPGVPGHFGVPRVPRSRDSLDSHATVMMRLRSNSIGVTHPSWL